MSQILTILKLLYSYKNLILIVFFLVNIITFIMYAVDKYCAQRGLWRIRETYLLTAAFLFGAPGALFSMVFLRHKINKPKFRTIVPVLAVIYVGIVFVAISLQISGVYDISGN